MGFLKALKVMPSWLLCITIALTLLSAAPSSPPCDEGGYWDSAEDRCVPCSLCPRNNVVLRPCGVHQDTLCGPVADLQVDWSWMEEQLEAVHESQVADSTWDWDWQATVLSVAALACVAFFVVAAAYSVHHARQWRLLEEHFEADVEELSARLALMSSATAIHERALGSGRGTAQFCGDHSQDGHCTHLEQLLAGKGSSTHSDPGNVYIEESSGKT